MSHHDTPRSAVIVQVETELKRRFVEVIKAEDPETNLAVEFRRYMRWRVRKHAQRQEPQPPLRRSTDRPRRVTDEAQNEDGRPRHGAPVSPTSSREVCPR